LLHVAGVVQRSRCLSNIRSVLVVAAVAMIPARGDGDATSAAIAATAPYDVLAYGFEDPSGITVQSDGSVLVVDRRAGSLTRISPDGTRQNVLDNLNRPRGVAIAAGSVFVLEPRRVLRLDPEGIVSIVSDFAPQARAITSDPHGRIWIAVRPSGVSEEAIMRLEPSGALTRMASGFRNIRALAADDAGLYVAAALAGEEANRTTLARLRWRPDGTAGPVESLLRNVPRQPNGVAVDATGDVFATGLGDSDPASGVVLKRRTGGEVAIAVSGLWRPGAAAFGPDRRLFVVERSVPARVLRFNPPPAPAISVTPYINRTPIRIDGSSERNSLIKVMPLIDSAGPIAVTITDPDTGAFSVTAPVAENAETRLSVTATAAAGNGLLGLPAIATVVHDDHLPHLEILEPAGTAHVRTALVARARASDEGSGMETLQLMIDELTQSVVAAGPDGEPLEANAIINLAEIREGPHTLTAAASDRAGNWATMARLVVVDRTAPDTVILAGPPAEGPSGSVSFTFGGSDEQSADLEFSWRLDAGAWSLFSGASTVQLTGLAPGAHGFEVAARDRAGNVDATPAVQGFIVVALRVRIVEPAPGAAITTETMWVRGTIDSAGDVDVRIPLPEIFQKALATDALAARYEAGTFAAQVPVMPGMTSISVTARDNAGGVAIDTVSISVLEPLFPALRLEVFPPAGLAPHTVRFPANGFPAGSVYSLDLESDGIPEYAGNALAEQEFVYARPGVHLATLRITTPDDRMLTARAAVDVYDRPQLDARLQAVWSGFKTALRAGDAAEAASFLHGDRRAAWAEYFGRLTPAQFAETDATFTDILLLEVTPGRAECEMTRDVGALLYSFPIAFEIDVDGEWRLWQF
jgi:sugar lactone lactonase YvrE